MLTDKTSSSMETSDIQRGIYCYCDDFLSFMTDMADLAEGTESKRLSLVNINLIFDYILEKYQTVFKLFDVSISCDYMDKSLKLISIITAQESFELSCCFL